MMPLPSEKLLGSATGKFGQAAVSSTAQETWLVQALDVVIYRRKARTAFSSFTMEEESCVWRIIEPHPKGPNGS
ncbi:hypothetical protein OPV22_006777 [Ensete ventricosum]|uniref:Uncharacterized protein n=1 Tax=Ensete ventricosum TaxID=4639 RepID=A0AAV8RSE2_ENSVE|nr:hypothetical protein OPV22_006777 [Ensete ventricosum]